MDNGIMHETKTHGKLSFPYIVYRGNIPEYMRTYPLHWHDEMEIIYVVKGQGLVTVQASKYALQTGDMIVLLPQIVHSIEQLDNAEMEYFNILFQFSLLDSGVNDYCYQKYFKPFYEHTKTVPPYLPAGDPLNRLLVPYICDLIQNRKQSYNGYELMVKSALFAIMHYLDLNSTQTSGVERSLQTTYEKLKQLLSYIRANYAKPISITQAAAICGFSESHFMKLFKDLTGNTFTQYLKNFRLEAAAAQLAEGSQKVIEVSENVGFHNHSYFTRSFAARYGLSPLEYKKSVLPAINNPHHSGLE